MFEILLKRFTEAKGGLGELVLWGDLIGNVGWGGGLIAHASAIREGLC